MFVDCLCSMARGGAPQWYEHDDKKARSAHRSVLPRSARGSPLRRPWSLRLRSFLADAADAAESSASSAHKGAKGSVGAPPADLRCCSDQAFRECKHQRAKPARGRAASTGCCFAPHLFLRAWRWRERHDGRPQRVPSRSLRQETSKLISVQPVLGFQSCRAWSSSNGCRFFFAPGPVARARGWRGARGVACGVAWRGVFLAPKPPWA